MAFIPQLPSFNLEGLWVGPPAFEITFQLYLATRDTPDEVIGGDPAASPAIYVRLGREWAVTLAAFHPWVGRLVEYVGYDLRIYTYVIRWWEFTHAGFGNEYLTLLVEQCNADGTTPDSDR